MNNWQVSILRIISSKGGTAELQEIYKDVESGEYLKLNEEHFKIIKKHGDRPAYQHQVRSHLSDLKDLSDIDQCSRAEYSLTSKGYKRLKDIDSGNDGMIRL